VGDERPPTATDVQMSVPRLHVHVAAHRLELALLGRLQALVDVAKDAAGVHHGVAEEPIVEVVAAVVDVSDVSLVRLSTVAHVGAEELLEVELDVAPGEAEAK